MAETSRRRDPVKERLWREVIGRQRTSGLSIAEFCLREGLNRASFHNWRREIARRNAEAPVRRDTANGPRRSSPKSATGDRQRVPAFVPVVLKDDVSSAVVEVVLPDRTTVRVSADCDGRTLSMVLAALAEQRTTPVRVADAGRDGEAPPC
jgi:hypothetical protein